MAHVLISFIVAGIALAQEPIRYTLRFPDPQTHRIEVEAIYPTEGKKSVTLKMAVWTAYVVREYSQHVDELSTPLGATKVQKNRWEVQTGGQPSVTVRYRLFTHSMHVQDDYTDANFALINGQPTFLTLADGPPRAHEVKVELPPSWKTTVSPMKQLGQHRYVAADYEELVDSPLIAGNPAVHEFTVDGKIHRLVNVGEKGKWDAVKSTADLAKIVAAQRDIWGALPYTEYTFFNILSGKGGGMEHASSTVMMASENATHRRDTYLRWLGLASHELFHAWNVKRLRPREITPGEYEVEQYTPSLGIAEGFTSYYGLLSMRRAGVMSESEFFDELSRTVEALQHSDGRKVQSLADSSFDTWIKFYRPNENSSRTTVSYYIKGAVVGFLLDARIRHLSNNQRSLDTVMREALKRYPRERGYTLAEFQELTEVDLKPWFYSTAELDYREAEQWLGLAISGSGKVEPRGKNENRERWLSGK